MDEFHSLGATLAATRSRQMRAANGDTEVVDALASFRAAMIHVLYARIEAQPVMDSWSAVLDYLRATMAFEGIERVRMLYLNTRNALIRDEIASEGTIDEAALHVREVLRRAIELNAASMIIVHNHPGGDPTPSRADIEITRRIAEGGRRIGITLHDHLVIASQGHASLRALGLL